MKVVSRLNLIVQTICMEIQFNYVKNLKPDEGDPNPSAEFDVAESGPVGRA